MTVPVNVGNIAFDSKKAAKDYVRGMLDKYESFSSLSAADRAFVLDLLYMHPQYEHKLGRGISLVYVDWDRQSRRDKSLYIVRVDGTEAEFGWDCCIDERNRRHDVLEAFRRAVEDHIRKFKRDSFARQTRCPVTRMVIDSLDSHVDHKPPKTFNWLVCMFLKQQGAELAGVSVARKGDELHLQDAGLKRAWRAFYRREAQLRLVHRDVPYQ